MLACIYVALSWESADEQNSALVGVAVVVDKNIFGAVIGRELAVYHTAQKVESGKRTVRGEMGLPDNGK